MRLDQVFVNVSIDQLRTLLLTFASRLSGFTATDVEDFCASVNVLDPDDDAIFEPTVSFQGEHLPFVVDVFKDAQGALEAGFLLAPMLTPLVQNEARSLVGAEAVRSIIAKQDAEMEK
jgi:hypothetical protein